MKIYGISFKVVYYCSPSYVQLYYYSQIYFFIIYAGINRMFLN